MFQKRPRWMATAPKPDAEGRAQKWPNPSPTEWRASRSLNAAEQMNSAQWVRDHMLKKGRGGGAGRSHILLMRTRYSPTYSWSSGVITVSLPCSGIGSRLKRCMLCRDAPKPLIAGFLCRGGKKRKGVLSIQGYLVRVCVRVKERGVKTADSRWDCMIFVARSIHFKHLSFDTV